MYVPYIFRQKHGQTFLSLPNPSLPSLLALCTELIITPSNLTHSLIPSFACDSLITRPSIQACLNKDEVSFFPSGVPGTSHSTPKGTRHYLVSGSAHPCSLIHADHNLVTSSSQCQQRVTLSLSFTFSLTFSQLSKRAQFRLKTAT